MNRSISVKWEHEGEFRRLGLEVGPNCEGGHQLLLAKLAAAAPNLRLNNISLAWKDAEGDAIVLRSDADLAEAIREAKDGLVRVQSKVEKTSEEKTDGKKTGEPGEEDEETLHPGVTCDQCDASIRGIRYKCLQCPDYDLCRACNDVADVCHPGHNFIRISDPTNQAWKLYTLGTGGPMDQYYANGGSWEYGPQPQMWWGTFGGFPHGHGGGHGGRGFRRHHHGRHGGRPHCGFPFFGAGFGPQPPQADGEEKKTASADNNAGSNPTAPPPPNFDRVANAGATFLREVGEQVAAALGGMGIDVDVDVEHPKTGERERVAETNKDKAGDTAAAAAKETPDVTMSDGTAPPQPAEKQTREPSPQTGDWTMVEESAQKEDDGIQITKVVEGANAAAATAMGSVYPEVPQPQAPTMPAVPAHPDPTIQNAVEHMMAMGFGNENGWLTQLLELKRGNINAALDALRPNRH